MRWPRGIRGRWWRFRGQIRFGGENRYNYSGLVIDFPQGSQERTLRKDLAQVSVIVIDKATIQAVAQLIADRFDPEQIILFGSHARGNAGSHSDIDLLVVLKSLDDWPKRDNPIRAAIAEQFILPVDVLVTTPDLLAEQRQNPYSFVNTALESREILYERQAS